MLRPFYVSVIRRVRVFTAKTGVLAFLEKHRGKRPLLFVRSLFSIHDVVDMARLDLSWWTFSATAEIERFLLLRKGMANVFEYGSGASTIWLAKRARRVVYIEHDEQYNAVVHSLTKGLNNVSGMLIRPAIRYEGLIDAPSGRRGYENLDFAAYVAAIRDGGGPFDLIVIDGRARNSCLQEAVRHLKPDGVILFDNSRRTRYRTALEGADLRMRRFRGLTPTLPYPEETMILEFGGTAY